jgi:hypothetical protein
LQQPDQADVVGHTSASLAAPPARLLAGILAHQALMSFNTFKEQKKNPSICLNILFIWGRSNIESFTDDSRYYKKEHDDEEEEKRL